jgi:hypothetical protein
MTEDFKIHHGRVGQIALKSNDSVEGIILNEKNGQLEIRSFRDNKEGFRTVETTSILTIYSEPIIIIPKFYNFRR